MDVQRGHCWRCEKLMIDSCRRCGNCFMAEYCDIKCLFRDAMRHGSFECLMLGTKTCVTCNKRGVSKECGQCNDGWYCNRECQVRNWPNHKSDCTVAKAAIKSMAKRFAAMNKTFDPSRRVMPRYYAKSPYYMSIFPAIDFLQLDNNEWSEMVRKRDLVRDYYVLSAASGTLSNTVLTAASLPARYQGKLYITLNDFDPFVMARNVLFLFMLVRFADTEGIESSLTTIWYSVHITKKEYDLIKTSLDELIHMTPQSLQEVTQGLVKVQDEDLAVMSQVWDEWRSLECQRDKETSINLRDKRKAVYKIKMHDLKSYYIDHLPTDQRQKMLEWFDHGLFLPYETREAEMPFDNPTLTAQKAYTTKEPSFLDLHVEDKIKLAEPKDTFIYCVRFDSVPFAVWDCLRVRESETGPCSSPMVMYHNYITKLFKKFKNLIQQGRLYIQVSLANCTDFPSVHTSLHYDRIFTSTLSDFVGFPTLLRTFRPLLNSKNRFSVIVTTTANWAMYTEIADIMNEASNEQIASYALYNLDMRSEAVTRPVLEDYHFNTPMFLGYLRANLMGGAVGLEPTNKTPTFSDVKTCHGMRMRDFRKELNKLVPFKYRVNARDLTLLNGFNRSVEWCLPNNNT